MERTVLGYFFREVPHRFDNVISLLRGKRYSKRAVVQIFSAKDIENPENRRPRINSQSNGAFVSSAVLQLGSHNIFYCGGCA
jgi:hypothetical protein